MSTGGIASTPPMPPVKLFHSEKIVTDRTCSPSEAATKYSPRTLSAGSASRSDTAPAATIAAG